MPRFQGIFDIVLRLILSIFAAKDLYALFTKSVKKCNGNVQSEGVGGRSCSCQKSRGMIGYPSSKAVDMLSGPTWRSDIFPSILRSAIQKTSFIREEKWVLFFCLYWSFFETSQQTIPSWLIWNFWFVCSVKNTISSEKLFVKSESWFTREED